MRIQSCVAYAGLSSGRRRPPHTIQPGDSETAIPSPQATPSPRTGAFEQWSSTPTNRHKRDQRPALAGAPRGRIVEYRLGQRSRHHPERRPLHGKELRSAFVYNQPCDTLGELSRFVRPQPIRSAIESPDKFVEPERTLRQQVVGFLREPGFGTSLVHHGVPSVGLPARGSFVVTPFWQISTYGPQVSGSGR